jgi:hypothetical protein
MKTEYTVNIILGIKTYVVNASDADEAQLLATKEFIADGYSLNEIQDMNFYIGQEDN